MSAKQDGGGGRDRTRADAVLETAALPLSYTPYPRSVIPGLERRELRNAGQKNGPWGRSRTAGLLIHIQAFWPLNYRRDWCRWADLNNRPSPYESAALPLSYTGVPPHGFEPRSPHSKCGILPLDEGGGNRLRAAGGLPKGYARALRSRKERKEPRGCGGAPGALETLDGRTGGRGTHRAIVCSCPTGAG